jgi:hypothetical protein
MINKLILQAVINKYYLGTNESVMWDIKNNTLSIDFMTPSKDVIGNIKCSNFKLEDSKLAIYDTKKLLNLIAICSGDLILEPEKNHNIFSKLKISDVNFNLTYALSDPMLINKVGTVNVPEWDIKLDLTQEDIDNLVKAKNALTGVDDMLITTTTNLEGDPVCEFMFGDITGHNNKITYQIKGEINKTNIKLPFNSEMFKTILQYNKDMNGGILYMNEMGLMKIEFNYENISSDYFLVRKTETSF